MSAVVPMTALPPRCGVPVPTPALGLVTTELEDDEDDEPEEHAESNVGPPIPTMAAAPAVAAPLDRNVRRLMGEEATGPPWDSSLTPGCSRASCTVRRLPPGRPGV